MRSFPTKDGSISTVGTLASLCLVVCLLVTQTLAADYHVDSQSGDDVNSGLAPAQAWKSLAPVNAKTFQPGDRILLKAGTRYTGPLAPQGSGKFVEGTDEKPGKVVPITLGKYGDGPLPRIDGEGIVDTLLIRNIDYWEIHDLEISNQGEATQPWRTGVHMVCDGFGAMKSIKVGGLFVHDVNGDLRKSMEGCGIYFESRGGPDANGVRPHFEDLLIEKCHVVKTDRNGICQRTTGAARSTGVVIRNNLLEDIGGDGIKLWGTNGGLVEYNTIKGARTRCTDAAAGIWPFASDNCIFQFNEVGGVKGTTDGQGFDSDYQSRGNIFQYNYSHDNEGGFFLVCAPGNSYCDGTIIRYNISQNDGVDTARVFHFGGNSTNTLVHNNIVYISPKQNVRLFLFTEWSRGNASKAAFYNNIFYVDGEVRYEWGKSSEITFENNVFYGKHTGMPQDPKAILTKPALANPGGGGDGFKSLAAYRWISGAPALRGNAIEKLTIRDFFGGALPLNKPLAIGVHEVP